MERQLSSTRTERVDSPLRRRVLLGVGGTFVGSYTVGVTGATGQQRSVTVSIDNVGASAWEVTDVEGDEDVAPVGAENPTLTLRVGTRYTFENGGWSVHPLAVRDANDDPLLSQSDDGTFEDDDAVDWVDDGDTLAFTLTEALAEELDDYVCTVHPAMNGGVETTGTQDEPAAAVTFSEQTTDGTTVSVASVRMDDGGFVTIHDSTLQDGDAIGSVIGVSGYLSPGSYDDVTVELDAELGESQTLIAMPHRDTNGNETYDFVESGGDEDGPYTDDAGAITDSATVTVEQQEPAAAVTLIDHAVTDATVYVDSVRMDDGGFVTIHDDSLLDGDALGSVIGVSEYLGPGSYDAVPVELDEPLDGNQTLIAMPHRDTNDNEEYDFVESGGDEDGPYTDDEGAITDSAEITVEPPEPPAEVTFDDQTIDAPTVIVERVRMDDGGFVTIHDSTLQDGDAIGSVVGVSEYLAPGSSEAVTVELDDPLEEDGTLIAMPHRDTNDNQAYDFVESGGDEDGPYTDDAGAITDSASVFLEEDGGQMTPTETVTETDEMTTETVAGTDQTGDGTETDGEDGGGPGFGPIAGLTGLGGVAVYAYRKLGLEDDPPTPADDGLVQRDEHELAQRDDDGPGDGE